VDIYSLGLLFTIIMIALYNVCLLFIAFSVEVLLHSHLLYEAIAKEGSNYRLLQRLPGADAHKKSVQDKT